MSEGENYNSFECTEEMFVISECSDAELREVF